MGLHLQFFRRAVPLEIPSPFAVSGARDVWRAAAFNGVCAGGATGRAGPRSGSVRATQTPHAATATDVSLHGAPASFSLRHGRWTNAEADVFRGAGENALLGAALKKNVARPGNGGRPAATFDSRRTGQFCGDAHGQS